MAKKNKRTQDRQPTVTISLINYDSAKQDDYSNNFMEPLIEGLLKRMQLAKAK